MLATGVFTGAPKDGANPHHRFPMHSFRSSVRSLPVSIRHALALALLAGASAPALAQNASATDLDAVEVRAPIARSSGTATKTDTPIREIPQSISVVTDQQMRDRAIHGI